MSARVARRCAAVVIGLCCGLQTPAWGGPLALRVGLIPFAPATEMVQRYGAMADHLTAGLDLGVTIVGAPDYAEFIRRMLAEEYEVVLVAPHVALLGMREGRWRPLVRVQREHQPVVIVPRNSTLRTLAHLRGRTVATPDRLALVTLVFEAEAARQPRLVPGRDLTVLHTTTHENVVLLVSRGLADAGVTVPAQLERMPGRTRAQLRVLHAFPLRFELVYMASSRLNERLRESIRAELMRLPRRRKGRSELPGPGIAAHGPLDEDGLRRYAALLPLLQARLQEASVP